MREILFRGKRTDFNRWIEGYLYRLSEKLNPFIMIKNQGGTAFEVIPESISQFTGLTDKNGKKIFEGDIVKCISSDFVGRPKTDTITVNDMTDYNTLVYLNCSNEIEVIGNIHDNPELLKGGEG